MMNFKELIIRAKRGENEAQEALLEMYQPIISKESIIDGVFDEDLLVEDDFFTELGKNIFAFLRTACENGDDMLVTLSASFTPEQLGRITEIRIARMQLDSNGTDVLLECIANLKSAVEEKRAEGENPLNRLDLLLKKKRGE